VDFRANGGTIEVSGLRSGYKASQLESTGPVQSDTTPSAAVLLMHRDFRDRFG